ANRWEISYSAGQAETRGRRERSFAGGLEAYRVARGVAAGRTPTAPARAGAGAAPAGAVAIASARVEAEPGDDHVGVAGVGVDGDPATLAPLAPAHEAAGVERRIEQAAAVQ